MLSLLLMMKNHRPWKEFYRSAAGTGSASKDLRTQTSIYFKVSHKHGAGRAWAGEEPRPRAAT